MSDEVVIRVEKLGKRYRIRHQQQGGMRYKALRDVLADGTKSLARRLWSLTSVLRPPSSGSAPSSVLRPPSSEDFWALKDVSFEVKQGETLGIIGRNGAGKSTLLKILSRITEPTEGRARINGRVASLLEVGTGFHPELTGRENIFLNGAILGMHHGEIKRKFDEIVAFAEVEKFLDTPVKRYSSGMYVRLAFAVAAHLEPEILIVDEVLAVGDAAFQKKCLGKMGDVARAGRTILFVSHNMGAVHSLTRTGLYLKEGKILEYGSTAKVTERYFADTVEQRQLRTDGLDSFRRDLRAQSPVRITGLWVGDSPREIPVVNMHDPFTVHIELTGEREINGANLTLSIKNAQGIRVAVLFSWDAGFHVFMRRGKQRIEVRVSHLPLTPGQYSADAGINQSTETQAYDGVIDVPLLRISNSGQVVHWPDRPWGTVHWNGVQWNQCET
jgi:lipopolysaccharide transport system ATP-binding protein